MTETWICTNCSNRWPVTTEDCLNCGPEYDPAIIDDMLDGNGNRM